MYTYIYTNIYINLFLMYGNVMLEIEEQAINKHIYYLKFFLFITQAFFFLKVLWL